MYGQGHSESSRFQLMLVQGISSEPLNRPGMVIPHRLECYAKINWSFKVKVTVKTGIIKIWHF